MSRGKVAAGVLSTLVLAACAQDEGPRPGEIGFVPGFYGAIAADEPNAVLVARDALTAGGSAADAAVALTFALTVTYPAGVSLGGSGICVIHDAVTGVTEALDFLAPGAQGAGAPAGDRPAAVPGLPRGMAALHARYGRMDWGQLVAPAERLARFGHPISRALNRKLGEAAGPLFADPGMASVFSAGRAGREPIAEGSRIEQFDLASVLGRIRLEGAGAVHVGPLATRLIDAYAAAGGAPSPAVWRDYVASWRRTVSVPVGNDLLHVSPPPAGGGIVMAQLWSMGAGLSGGVDDPALLHGLAEQSRRAIAGREAWLGRALSDAEAQALVEEAALSRLGAGIEPGRATPSAASVPGYGGRPDTGSGTGFVVADLNGLAVACSLTNYNPFGTGRIAPGTGIVPAAAPGVGAGRDAAPLTAGIVANPNSLAFRMAFAGGEGAASAVAAARVLDATQRRGVALRGAVEAPRLYHPAQPDLVALEPGAGEAAAQTLRGLGHRVEIVPGLGRVNAIWCPSGLPTKIDQIACDVVQDPRGFGLSAMQRQ